MSKKIYSLAKLLKELQVAEGIIGHKKSVHVMEKGSASFSAKKGKKKKNVPKENAQSKRNPWLVKASRKASASHTVRRVIGRTIIQRNLTLKTVTPHVCLLLLSLKHV